MRTATRTVERSKAEALGAWAALASCLLATEAAGKSRVSAQHSTDPATGLCIKDGNLLDSTCGSGHMFSYAFGLRYSIYDDVGYSVNEKPDPILGVNSCDSMENWSLHNE